MKPLSIEKKTKIRTIAQQIVDDAKQSEIIIEPIEYSIIEKFREAVGAQEALALLAEIESLTPTAPKMLERPMSIEDIKARIQPDNTITAGLQDGFRTVERTVTNTETNAMREAARVRTDYMEVPIRSSIAGSIAQHTLKS